MMSPDYAVSLAVMNVSIVYSLQAVVNTSVHLPEPWSNGSGSGSHVLLFLAVCGRRGKLMGYQEAFTNQHGKTKT